MNNPKHRSSPKGSIFIVVRVVCLTGIFLLAAGTILISRGKVQASPMRGPVGQGEAVVQFRATARVHTPESTNEFTIMEDLLFPQLLISFKNNTVSGSASDSTAFNYLGKDWTGEGTIEIEGTYNPKTGVVEGTMNYYLIYRFPPDQGFHDNRVDVHYYGPFKSWYEDPADKFSLEDATLDLIMPGTVASDRYYDNISDVNHSENPASVFIQFVREGPVASDCTASVYGLDPLVPGDVISPGASYTAPDGTEVGIIQERWFINDQETNSAAWDGNHTTVELQWTCLGHQAHSQTFEIAAYVPPTLPAAPDPNLPAAGEPGSPASPAGPGLGDLANGLGLGLIGIGGLAGLAGLLGLGIPIVKAITAPAMVAATAPAQPVAVPVHSPALAAHANPPAPKPGKLDPSLKKPWELKINNLIDQRTAIQENIQATNDQIIRLTRLYKNNILKVIMKGGLETGEILFEAASGGAAEVPNLGFELGKKMLNDKLMNKSFQKHDTAQDGRNVVDLKNLIDNLKGQRDGLRDQVREINREIKSIQQYIQNEF